jgi:hypothetical protein
MQVLPESTILHIKIKMYDKGVSDVPKNIRLVFEGKQLENDKHLADYNIQKDSTLHETSTLDGGMIAEGDDSDDDIFRALQVAQGERKFGWLVSLRCGCRPDFKFANRSTMHKHFKSKMHRDWYAGEFAAENELQNILVEKHREKMDQMMREALDKEYNSDEFKKEHKELCMQALAKLEEMIAARDQQAGLAASSSGGNGDSGNDGNKDLINNNNNNHNNKKLLNNNISNNNDTTMTTTAMTLARNILQDFGGDGDGGSGSGGNDDDNVDKKPPDSGDEDDNDEDIYVSIKYHEWEQNLQMTTSINATIDNIKGYIQAKKGIPSHQQRLHFKPFAKGRASCDDVDGSLKKLAVESGDSFHLVS